MIGFPRVSNFVFSCGAVAIGTLFTLGMIVVESETRREHAEQQAHARDAPMSLMQTSVSRVAPPSIFLQKSNKKRCPSQLLQEHPDCVVVSFRGGFPLGPKGMHPPAGKSAIVVNKAFDGTNLPEGNRNILGWAPNTQWTHSTVPGEEGKLVELVHHMNVMTFRGNKLEPGKLFNQDDPATAALNGDEEIFSLVTVHDRGAGAYILPKGYGIDASEPITLEFHYLFPKGWDHTKNLGLENSGMDMYMTHQATRYPAALIGALNRNMNVRPGQGAVDVVTRIDPMGMRSLSFPSAFDKAQASFIEKQSAPEILAVHLHTHDLTQSKFFQIKNPDGTLLFRSKKEPGGYGKDEQSFISIAKKGWPRLQLQPGQQMELHCQMETDHLDHTVNFGLDWGKEMCAPLLVVGGQAKVPSVISGDMSSLVRLGRALKGFFGDVAKELARLTSGP